MLNQIVATTTTTILTAARGMLKQRPVSHDHRSHESRKQGGNLDTSITRAVMLIVLMRRANPLLVIRVLSA